MRAAPRPASFSFSKMDSGEEQQVTGQCTTAQILEKGFTKTLSTPFMGSTIRLMSRTSASQQMLRTLSLVFTDSCGRQPLIEQSSGWPWPQHAEQTSSGRKKLLLRPLLLWENIADRDIVNDVRLLAKVPVDPRVFDFDKSNLLLLV